MSQMQFAPRKSVPEADDTANHRLLVQAGFVRQVMAGVYAYLPLGLRVLNKLRNIIREEMNALGAQELLMPSLHPAENWKTTGGWDKIDVLFKLKSRTEKDYALGQSHEEVITPLMREFINSYKDLPLAVYQISWKFRDELRAKSGIMRGREFEMKDMYSFHKTQEDFDKYYQTVKEAYLRTYDKLGLKAKVTEATGGTFTDKISYEFMVLANAGEDEILYCDSCEYCVNTSDTTLKKGDDCSKCQPGKLIQSTASEVGNVFDLGQKFAKDFGLKYTDAEGKENYPIMGCYGWGTTRTMGVLVEKFHDDKGIVWPKAVAPYIVHIVSLRGGEEKAKELYHRLSNNGIDTLWDDRADKSPGEKFGDADLIGCPYRLVISEKSLAAGGVELKERSQDTPQVVSSDKIMNIINKEDK